MQNNDDLSLKSDSCQKWKVKVWLNSYLGLKTESIDIDKEWPNCQPIIWCDFHIFPHISIYLHIFPYLSIVVLKPSRLILLILTKNDQLSTYNLMWFSSISTYWYWCDFHIFPHISYISTYFYISSYISIFVHSCFKTKSIDITDIDKEWPIVNL